MSNLSIGFSINTDVKQIYMKNALYNDINNANYYFPNELLRIISNLQKEIEDLPNLEKTNKAFFNIAQELLSTNDIDKFREKYNGLLPDTFIDFLINVDEFYLQEVLDKEVTDDDVYLLNIEENDREFPDLYIFSSKINKLKKILTVDNFIADNDYKFYNIKYLDYDLKLEVNTFNLEKISEVDVINLRGNNLTEEGVAPILQELIKNRQIYKFSENKTNLLQNFTEIKQNTKSKINKVVFYYKDLFQKVTLTTTVEKYKIIPKNWSILFLTTFKEYSRCFYDLKYTDEDLYKIFLIMMEKDLLKDYHKLISSSLQFEKLNY